MSCVSPWRETSARSCVKIDIAVIVFSSMMRWNLNAVFLALILVSVAAAQTATPANAIALEQQGKLAEAAQVWRSVTLHHPKDAAAYASLGVVLSKQEKYAEAAVAYRKALALNPKLPVELNLGRLNSSRGRFSEAIAPFNRVVTDDSNNLQARHAPGLLERKNFLMLLTSCKLFRKPSQTMPNCIMCSRRAVYGQNNTIAHRNNSAILEQEPDSAAAHMLLGQALDGLEKTPRSDSRI